MTDLTVELARAIEPPWTTLTTLPIGAVPPGRGTPNLYAFVSRGGKPSLRLDVYGKRSISVVRSFRSDRVA